MGTSVLCWKQQREFQRVSLASADAVVKTRCAWCAVRVHAAATFGACLDIHCD